MKKSVMFHTSTHLSVSYPYIKLHYAVHPKLRTDAFHADRYLQLRYLRVLLDVLERTVSYRNVKIRIACRQMRMNAFYLKF